MMASETTAARLLDLKTPHFLKLVDDGHLPPGREIAPGVVRWDTETLKSLLKGEGVVMWDRIQW